MSTIYKERDRERDVSRTSYTKYKTYRLPDRDDDNASVIKERDVVVRRDREPSLTRKVDRIHIEREIKEREPRRDIEYRVVEREEEHPRRDVEIIKRETRVEHSPAGRDYKYERELVRVPSPPSDHVSQYREVRELERPRPRDWDLERYVRSVEYAPQPIIIHHEPQPIIIREVARDPVIIERPRYERDEIREDRQIVRREEPKHRDEEDYYYERRTREVDRGPRRDGGGEHFDEREHRRHREYDTASRHDDHSDEGSTHVYRRKETTIERDRSGSPHHKRHLVEGAAAGAGVAEIIRHHRKAQGEDTGHRGRNLVGSAALGAVGAEVLSRVHRAKSRHGSHSRHSRSRSWSRSSDEDDYRRSRHRKRRSRSRSRSKSRVRQLGSVAAVAAVGALAGYALRNRNKQPQLVERRSRSRIRRGSMEREEYHEQRSMSASPARKPENQNRRIAQAGLASAAAAGLWQRIRSRSRKGKDRSRSRIREGIPIAAAGLGGAAVAGLYERNKAKKNGQPDEHRGRSLSASRSRSRSRGPDPYPYGNEPGLRHAASDPALIEYGEDPIYTERPGEYRRRHRGTSSDSSPDRRHGAKHRERSRSRAAGFTEAAAVAGIAGAAAHELTKRSERKKEKERRRREREEEELYAQEHPPYTPPPMGANAGEYTPQAEFYPQTQTFPPPPTNEFPPSQEYPPYNPADYPPPPGATPVAVHNEHYPASPVPQHGYAPNDTFLGDTRYDHQPASSADHARRAAENVSPHPGPAAEAPLHDGLDPPRSKSVAFASHDAPSSSSDRPRHRRRRHRDDTASDTDIPSPITPRDRNPDRSARRRNTLSSAGNRHPPSVSSESTESLPARFDEHGRRMHDHHRGGGGGGQQGGGGTGDVFGDKLADILAGRGTVGGLFRRLTGDLFQEGERRGGRVRDGESRGR